MKRKVLSIICVMTVAATSLLGNVVTASATNHSHSYTQSVVREAQCDVKGKVKYTCSCGYEYTETIPATGHTYKETVIEKSTCSQRGTITKECTVCGSKFTGKLPKADHDFETVDGVTKCKTCGKVYYAKSTKPITTEESNSEDTTEETASTETEKSETTTKETTKITDTRSASDKARQGAVDWAIKIANDNSFHYGRSSWAHHNGCYFCGTNQKSGSLKRKAGASKAACAKTYCCNPFVTAAFKHGAGAKEVDCKVPKKRINLANDSNPALNNKKAFKKISKPKKVTSLKAGDVLLTPTHAMLYAGNGKIVEAAHADNGVRNSYWNDSIRYKKISSSQWKKVTKIYRYIGNGRY